MKVPYSWLKEYVDIDISPEELQEKLFSCGFEVEELINLHAGIDRVVVGKITEAVKQEGTHLTICKLDCGEYGKDIQISTGADNIYVGAHVPAALDSATLPGGITIKSKKMRGVESNGMLCSLKELGLTLNDFPYAIEDGIWILQEDCKPGDDINTVIGNDDTVVDFEITNNRPDCYSILGLAREAAAAFNKPMRHHDPVVRGGAAGELSELLEVEVPAEDLCRRYTARMVRNVKIAPSPKWLRQRLRANGVRPINNIVDITNYVMLEYGQPMHAFDYRYVSGGKIIVRRAEEGESLRTLDGNDHALTPGMLVIADPEGPVALAGVMGGANSEITDETTTIVFESANFLGHSIRKTAIALGMRTDASGRFEKGLDLFATVPAVDRACELVEMLGAGEVFDGTIDVLAKEPETTFIELDDKRINALLGTDIPREFMADTLTSLGFELNGNTLTVPSWRGDCTMLADIAEECARFWGYDKIEATDIRGAATQGGYSEKTLFVRKLGTACRAMGYTEVVTYSFVSPSSLDKIKVPADSPLRDNYRILNPLGEDTSVMRTTALPSMLGVLSTNLSRRNMEAKLYEMATVYKKQPGKVLADERTVLTLGAYGGDVDFFALKGAVEALLCAARTPDVRFTADTETAAFHPGRCAAVWSGDTRLGTLGQIHPDVCAAYGLDGATYCAEIDVVLLHDLEGAEPVYTPLPRFPAITRDIAVVCDAAVPVGELTECIRKAEKNVLRGVKLFDVYTGVGIPEGKKSVAFSLTLRSDDGTLTDDHAEEAVRAVLDALRENFGAVIR